MKNCNTPTTLQTSVYHKHTRIRILIFKETYTSVKSCVQVTHSNKTNTPLYVKM